MGRAIKRKTGEEGEIFNKWLESRLVRNNKNVLSAELGPTGSGKSYRDLRKAELWYKYHFKQDFPTKNICFGVAAVMQRLSEDDLRRGEVLIVEEAGVNLGSRDWQQKFSKMFNYILQSFRSMNIALFFNLPYLSMLDSQARHLLHYYGESVGIDYQNGINKCKPFFLQVAQGTGKIYRHYPVVKIDGRTRKVRRFNYSMPSLYLIEAYESKKTSYLKEMIKGFSEKVGNVGKKIKVPKEKAVEAYKLRQLDWSFAKIGTHLGVSTKTAWTYVDTIRNLQELYKNKGKRDDTPPFVGENPPQMPV